MVKEEEIKLGDNRMYIIMTPLDDTQFNIICVDKLKKPTGELYYLLRGLCEMSTKHQEDLVEIGKEALLQEKLKTAKDDLKSNIIPFRPRRGNGKKY